jgi:hypothetical protein
MAGDRSWLESGLYVPLLARHRVFLYAPCGDGEVFARRFIKVWKCIPIKDRRTLLRHWRQRPADPVTGQAIIAAMLVPGWGATEADTIAQCRETGHKLFFKHDHFQLCPGMLNYYIAHELAHATWTARGESAHMEAAAELSPDISREDDDIGKACEQLAEKLATEWGFRREWVD